MGSKGARSGPGGAAMAARLRDALAPMGEVTSKPMFGGHGIFCDGVMFGLVDSVGTPFLRIHDADADAETPSGTARHGRMPYWSVNEELLTRRDALLERARRSLDMARATSRR